VSGADPAVALTARQVADIVFHGAGVAMVAYALASIHDIWTHRPKPGIRPDGSRCWRR
jgi:hypothetical protein